MKAIHNISVDLLRRTVTPTVHAMQFDALTRVVQISLLAGGEAWDPPQGASFALSYRKPDGKRGFYETLPDGTGAISVSGNAVSVTVAPQALTVAGSVFAALVMRLPDTQRLSAFPFEIYVTADPAAGTTESEDYFNPGSGAGAADAVLYVPQELTEDQKAQARANIGAAAPGEGDSGGGSIGALTGWEIVQSSDAVTLNYTLEDGSEHTDVITLDANGYPVSITHDGVAAPGAWREADV